MGRLEEEYKEWNSPVIGAYLLWQFCIGYCKDCEKYPSIIELIIAYSLLSNKRYLEHINGRKEGFSSYIRSFTRNKQSDLLLCFSNEVKEKLELAFSAIDIAVNSGLLVWDVENAFLIPIGDLKSKRGTSSYGVQVQLKKNKAQILGKWFSKSNIKMISSSLGVVL